MSGMDLSEFLLARIAEDEAYARAASQGPWRSSTAYANVPEDHPEADSPIEWSVDCRPSKVAWDDGEGRMAVESLDSWDGAGAWSSVIEAETDRSVDFDHIARHDPARVLAECGAKRRIVERHPQVKPPGDYYCGEDGEGSPCPTLRLLAIPYADHPDYRDDWQLRDE